jgi:lipopolysaccharide/colanic/teichoic acid biosynthesis glycosyltransferase
MKKFFKLFGRYWFFDLLVVILCFYLVLNWVPLSTQILFKKYFWPSLYFIITWLLISFLIGRYKPLRKQEFFNAALKLLSTSFIVFINFFTLHHIYFIFYSGFALLSISVGILTINYVVLSIYFAYRLATEYNELQIKPAEIRVNAAIKPGNLIDEKSYTEICKTIQSHSKIAVLNLLKSTVDLSSTNTKVYISSSPENLQMIYNYQFSTIVQLEKLNKIIGINKILTILNEKLPDNGIFVCCFETKSSRKKRILKQNPIGLNYIFYAFDFLINRIMPQLLITRYLYYLITQGRNRIFSKTEIIGRFYCYGFKVILDKKIGNLTYVFGQRVNQPTLIQKRYYGPFLSLNRIGKNGKHFMVYKMRTMNPYSEYIQDYIYKNNDLKKGGKFNRDIRITTLGSILRKYWLDELPMLINFLKGEMKLVGVRPLSEQYFNLYNRELQEKRIKYKPGLMPPFYADMPRTLKEIQASEMKYLLACEKYGVFLTDLRYFFLILKNILFKNAHSE